MSASERVLLQALVPYAIAQAVHCVVWAKALVATGMRPA